MKNTFRIPVYNDLLELLGEEVLKIIENWSDYEWEEDDGKHKLTLKEWFEQFKK